MESPCAFHPECGFRRTEGKFQKIFLLPGPFENQLSPVEKSFIGPQGNKSQTIRGDRNFSPAGKLPQPCKKKSLLILPETGEPDPVTPYPVGSSMTLDVDGKHPGKILRNPNTSTFIFIILTLASGVMAWVMHLSGNSEKYDRIMKRKMI